MSDVNNIDKVFESLEKRMNSYVQEELYQIRKAVIEEKKKNHKMIEVAFTICDKENYLLLGTDVFPMDPDDLEYIDQIGLELGEEVRKVGTVCIPVKEQHRRIIVNQLFEGCLCEGEKRYHAYFRLRPETKYLRILEELRNDMVNNHISETVFFDEYLKCFYTVEVLLKETSVPQGAVIDGFEVDFSLYKDYILCNCFPVWNVEFVSMKSNRFHVLQEDHTYYRSEFVLDDSADWVVRLPQFFDGYMSYSERGIYVFSRKSEWSSYLLYKIYRISDDVMDKEHILTTGNRQYSFPIVTNAMSNSIINHISMNRFILTKASLEQEVRGYKVSRLIEFVGFELKKEIWQNRDTAGEKVVYVYRGQEQQEIKESYICELTFAKNNTPEYLAEMVMKFLLKNLSCKYPNFAYRGFLLG